MKYQDPLEPMDNSQMVAQMAQFTTLEQLMTMGSTMSSYFNYQMANSVIQYSALIGYVASIGKVSASKDEVTTDKKDESATEKGEDTASGSSTTETAPAGTT